MLILLCACAGAPTVSDDTASSDSAVPVDTEDTAITEDTGEPGRFLVDEDGDGFAVAGGDCDDTDPTRRVGLLELPCDGIDQDCDGTVDESSECGDDDGDGTTDLEGDCHDGDPNVGPHAVEVPLNGIDDDCDGTVDAGSLDLDGDGFDPVPGPDCDDSRADLSPAQLEIPDGVDQDCDELIDEGTLARDEDGDCACPAAGGVCTSSSNASCEVLRTRDCDDGDATRFPGNPEVADTRDNDCDGTIDEGTVLDDIDGDGFSAAGGDCSELNSRINPGATATEDRCGVTWPECATIEDCDGDGVTPAGGDCHDGDVTVGPFGSETIDGVDEDCDGTIDEDTLSSDDDGDGASEQSGDCDDTDPLRAPGRQERIDSTCLLYTSDAADE